jgi:hypothetical protein
MVLPSAVNLGWSLVGFEAQIDARLKTIEGPYLGLFYRIIRRLPQFLYGFDLCLASVFPSES